MQVCEVNTITEINMTFELGLGVLFVITCKRFCESACKAYSARHQKVPTSPPFPNNQWLLNNINCS